MSAKEEIIVLKTSLLETYQESIQQHQLLYELMIKKVNKFAKELRQHIDSTYDELNNNVKELEAEVIDIDTISKNTSSTIIQLQNYAEGAAPSLSTPHSSLQASRSSLKDEKKIEDNVDRKYFAATKKS